MNLALTKEKMKNFSYCGNVLPVKLVLGKDFYTHSIR
jgi:hypothetical protein